MSRPPFPRPSNRHREVELFVAGVRQERSDPAQPSNFISSQELIALVCSHFHVSHFDQLGVGYPPGIPSIRHVLDIESRLWVFVSSYVSVRQICTLYECIKDFLERENVAEFYELGIGNCIVKAPILQQFFPLPVATTQIPQVTTKQIVEILHTYRQNLRSANNGVINDHRIDKNEFLSFVAQQFSVPHVGDIGVHVQGIGMYISMIRRIHQNEVRQMKALEEDFQKDVAEKVFKLTKEKFSQQNREAEIQKKLEAGRSMDKPVTSTSSSSLTESPRGGSGSAGQRRSKTPAAALASDILQRVTSFDAFLDHLLHRQRHQLPSSVLSWISKRDQQIRKRSLKGYEGSSRAKVIMWVVCSSMAKVQALLHSKEALNSIDPSSSSSSLSSSDDDDNEEEERKQKTKQEKDKEMEQDSSSEEDECTCCCVGMEECTCKCKCSCHELDSDPNPVKKTVPSSKSCDTTTTATTIVKTASSVNHQRLSNDEIRAQIQRWGSDIRAQTSKKPLRANGTSFLDTLMGLESHLETSFGAQWSSHVERKSFLCTLRDIISSSSQSNERMSTSASTSTSTPTTTKTKTHTLDRHLVQILSSCCVRCTNTKAGASFPELPAFINQYSFFHNGSMDGSELERQVLSHFGVPSIEALGYGSTEELLNETIGTGSSNPFAVCSSNNQFVYGAAMEGSEIQTRAVSCPLQRADVVRRIRSVPYLVDIHESFQWNVVFEAEFGELGAFVRKHVQHQHHQQQQKHSGDSASSLYLCFGRGSGSGCFRLPSTSTATDVLCSGKELNGRMMAAHLSSFFVQHGGLPRFPSELIKSHLCTVFRAIQTHHHGDSNTGGSALLSFVADVLCCIPFGLLGQLAAVILSPLTEFHPQYVQDLAKVQEGRDLRRRLFLCGIALPVNEWRKAFENSLNFEDFSTTTTTAVCSVEPSCTGIEVVVESSSSNTITSNSSAAVETSSPVKLEQQPFSPMQDSQCRQVVESIRKHEFGIGLEGLTNEAAKVFSSQKLRLKRALTRLSEELYSEDTHFVLELLQNADDNLYVPCDHTPAMVCFAIGKEKIVFKNNERGFQEKNIRALCDVGASTKTNSQLSSSSGTGYIGRKGIGFKSVFKVTDRPEIHSNGFHICFRSKEDELGYILPHWIENYRDTTTTTNEEGTTIVLPLNAYSQQNFSRISRQLSDIRPSLLLFLNKIQRIRLEYLSEDQDGRVLNEMEFSKIDLSPHGVVQLSANASKTRWKVYRKVVDVPQGLQSRAKVTEIGIAFPERRRRNFRDGSATSTSTSTASAVQNPNPNPKLPYELQDVFAFLPLRSYGLRFVLQGDFIVPSSRESINVDSPWNQWLLSEFPDFIVHAFSFFKGSAREGFDVEDFFELLPLEDEVSGPFQMIARKVFQRLRETQCFPVYSGCGCTWRYPSQVLALRASRIAESSFLGDDDASLLIQRATGKWLYEVQDSSQNPSSSLGSTKVLQALGVENLSVHHMTQVLFYLTSTSVETKSMNDDDNNNNNNSSSKNHVETPRTLWCSKKMEWKAECLAAVFDLMYADGAEFSTLREDVKHLPLFPILSAEGLSYVSLNDGALYLPPEDSLLDELSFSEALEGSLSLLSPLFVTLMDSKPSFKRFIEHGMRIEKVNMHHVCVELILPLFQDKLVMESRDISQVEKLSSCARKHIVNCSECQTNEIIREQWSNYLYIPTTCGMTCVSEYNGTVVLGIPIKEQNDQTVKEKTTINNLVKKTISNRAHEFPLALVDVKDKHHEWYTLADILGICHLLQITAHQPLDTRNEPCFGSGTESTLAVQPVCVGFEVVVEACSKSPVDVETVELFTCIARVLESQWDEYLLRVSDTTRDCRLNSIESRITKQLRNTKWVVVTTPQKQIKLEFPCNAYPSKWRASTTSGAFETVVSLCTVELTSSSFQEFVGFPREISGTQVLDMFEQRMLNEKDSNTPARITLEQCTQIYQYFHHEALADPSFRAELARRFRSKPLILTHRRTAKKTTSVSVYVNSDQVFWQGYPQNEGSHVSDNTTIVGTDPLALCKVYDATLREFFLEVLGTKLHATIEHYIQKLESLVSNERNNTNRNATMRSEVLDVLRACNTCIVAQGITGTDERVLRLHLKLHTIPLFKCVVSEHCGGTGPKFVSLQDKPVLLDNTFTKEQVWNLKLDQVAIISAEYNTIRKLLQALEVPTVAESITRTPVRWMKVLAGLSEEQSKWSFSDRMQTTNKIIAVWAHNVTEMEPQRDTFVSFSAKTRCLPTSEESWQSGSRVYIADDLSIKNEYQTWLEGTRLKPVDKCYFLHESILDKPNNEKKKRTLEAFLTRFFQVKTLSECTRYGPFDAAHWTAIWDGHSHSMNLALTYLQAFVRHQFRPYYDQLKHETYARMLRSIRVFQHSSRDPSTSRYSTFGPAQHPDGTARTHTFSVQVEIENVATFTTHKQVHVDVLPTNSHHSGLGSVNIYFASKKDIHGAFVELSEHLFEQGKTAHLAANFLYVVFLRIYEAYDGGDTNELRPIDKVEMDQWIQRVHGIQVDIVDGNVAKRWIPLDQQEALWNGADVGDRKRKLSLSEEEGEVWYVEMNKRPKGSNEGPGATTAMVARPIYPPLPPRMASPMVPFSSTFASTPLQSAHMKQRIGQDFFHTPWTVEDRKKIGLEGERIVYETLCRELSSSSSRTVEWLNEDSESGKPYDIVITNSSSCQQEYIEVKSTRSQDKKFFEITVNEVEMAMQHGSNFSIYRVYGVDIGSTAQTVENSQGMVPSPRIERIKNPIAMIRQKAVQLLLLLEGNKDNEPAR